MVIVSCSTKFHAFNLTEQLEKHSMLSGFYTSYAYQKNKAFRKFSGRIDSEMISPERIHTNVPLAIAIKGINKPYTWNGLFDQWVAYKIRKRKDYKVFIGWSSMSLSTIREVKKAGKIVVVERGSSHIQFQNNILQEEFRKFNIDYSIDKRVIKKELMEYAAADYISIPSQFVKRSFLAYGVAESKLICNPYGVSRLFEKDHSVRTDGRFRVLYLGTLSIRKGLIYLFEALLKLSIPQQNLEVYFIGSIDAVIKPWIEKMKQPNWQFFGHLPQHELPGYVSKCDIGVQPSVEEGLSMVLPQMMACGVPVVASANTGGEDIIQDGVSGFIVPPCASDSIAEKINWAYHHEVLFAAMKRQAAEVAKNNLRWDQYGNRYAAFIHKVTNTAE